MRPENEKWHNGAIIGAIIGYIIGVLISMFMAPNILWLGPFRPNFIASLAVILFFMVIGAAAGMLINTDMGGIDGQFPKRKT